jgi:hypothetical protein
VALALAVHKADKQEWPEPFEIVPVNLHLSAAFLGQLPGNCNKEAVCMNDPECRDVGDCLGFKDARMSPLYPVSKIKRSMKFRMPSVTSPRPDLGFRLYFVTRGLHESRHYLKVTMEETLMD